MQATRRGDVGDGGGHRFLQRQLGDDLAIDARQLVDFIDLRLGDIGGRLRALRQRDRGKQQRGDRAAARADRFEFPNPDPDKIDSTYSYAYHFDAGRYARYLRARCEAQGLARIEGRIDRVELDRESGDIAALRQRGIV